MVEILWAAMLALAWIVSLIIAFFLGVSICVDVVMEKAKAGLITLSGRAWRTTEVFPTDKGGEANG